MKMWRGLKDTQKGRADERGRGSSMNGSGQGADVQREEGTQDEVRGCWPSPATALQESQRVLAQRHSAAQPALPGKKIATFCESERLECQHDCQEKQGFQVEVTRGSSRSESGLGKTLPFAMATRFPLISPPTGTTPFSRAWQPGQMPPRHPPPVPRSSEDLVVLPGSPHQAGSTRGKAGTTHAHTHTRGFPRLVPWAASFFFFCAWLKRPPSSSMKGREVSKVHKWFNFFLVKREGRQ